MPNGRPKNQNALRPRDLGAALQAKAFEIAEVPPEREALLTTVPPGVKSRPGQLPQHCPFPQCAQSTGYGACWLTPREWVLHLNSVHLSCGHIPSPEFLSHYHQGVCSQCRALVAAGKPCPTCLNRARKLWRRSVRRPSPSQPKPTDSARDASVEPCQHAIPFSATNAAQAAATAAAVSEPPVSNAGEFDSHVPSLDQFLASEVTTMLHVPKTLRPLWNSILSRLLADFLKYYSRVSFQKVLLAPKCLLCPLSRGGGGKKRLVAVINSRLQRWQRGEIQQLWSEALRRAPKIRETRSPAPAEEGGLESGLVRRVTSAVAEGAYSKGLSILADCSKLATVNAASLSQLRDLHPAGPSISPTPNASSPLEETSLRPKQVLRCLRRFKPLSAPGPSGLRHTHLLEAADVPSSSDRKAFKDLLVQWVLQSAAGNLPEWCAPWISGAKLIPLLKPNGGIRPIAVGEVLRRLTSKVLQAQLSDQLADLLAPVQLGVGIRGATEQIGRKLQRLLAENPALHVLQIDLSNAFNSVDRRGIEEGLASFALLYFLGSSSRMVNRHRYSATLKRFPPPRVPNRGTLWGRLSSLWLFTRWWNSCMMFPDWSISSSTLTTECLWVTRTLFSPSSRNIRKSSPSWGCM